VVTSVHDSLIGQLIDGRYLVQERIALGGMATVYLATDKRLGRNVALKVMHPHLANGNSGQSFVSRFRREARAAARVTHPGLVGVYDQGIDGDISYLTLEYVEGSDLRHQLEEQGTFTVAKALAITEDTLDALAAAHRNDLIHRDVKPENILISKDNEVKITDFGLARAVTEVTATTGTVLGTVAYLAPEVVTTGVGDARTDVYSVGIMLFEMLTGRQPFVGDAPIHVAFRHVNEDVAAPSSIVPWIPPQLDQLVTRFSARDPENRPANASEALALLRATSAQLTPAQLQMRATPPLLSESTPGTSPEGEPPALQPDMSGNGLNLGDDTASFAVTDQDPLDKSFDSAPTTHSAEEPAFYVGSPEDVADEYDANQQKRPHVEAHPTVPLNFREPHGSTLALPLNLSNSPHSPESAPQASDDASSKRTQRHETSALHTVGLSAKSAKPSKKQKHAGRRALLAFLVLALLGGGGYGGYYWWNNVGPGSYTTVPLEIVGVTQEDSANMFTGTTLQPQYTAVFSDTVPAGEVIEANPTAGSRVKKDSTVDLSVSKGIEMHEVPTGLTGKPYDEVLAHLNDAGFHDVKEALTYNTKTKKNTVLAISEKEGTSIPHNTQITVTVANGPEPIKIQQVVGESEDSATKLLKAWELKVKVEKANSDTVPEGTVISQEPKQGTSGHRGDTVTITVSLGPELIEVPDVKGHSSAEATAILEARGFKVKVSKYLQGFFDLVRLQDAKEGTKIPKGSTITITVF